jgi:threonine/homoserine/homoserine lactone efflux protein
VSPLLLQGALLGLSAAASPGPFQAFLLAQSSRTGAARALLLAFVPLVSDPPVIAAVLLVLTQVPGGLLRAIQIGGALVVLWLAVATLRAALRPPPAAGGPPPARGFLRGALLNFTNPNAWIFWSAVGGPVVAAAWRARPAEALLFLAGFYAALTAGHGAIVLAAVGIGRRGARSARALGLASGLALVVFGGWQLARGLAGA